MRTIPIKLSERVALIYLSGVVLLETASLEGIAYAGGGFTIVRSAWLSPFALVLNSMGLSWAIWLGWYSNTVSSDLRMVFKLMAAADVILFVTICLLPLLAK